MSATNAGSKPTNGERITLTDKLPEGVTVQNYRSSYVDLFLVKNSNTLDQNQGLPGGETLNVSEAPAGEVGTVECHVTAPVGCTLEGAHLAPDDRLLMRVFVTVNTGTREGVKLPNVATVSGGGASAVSAETTNEVNAIPAAFGVSSFDFDKTGLNGRPETQAGGHPYELTTTIDLDTKLRLEPGQSPPAKLPPSGGESLKDVVVDLPLGLAGSTLAAPQCTEAQLISKQHCPPDTVVGHLTSEPYEPNSSVNSPIWNIAPEYGHPAEFGFIDLLKGAHVAGYVSVVPTPAGYVLRFVSSDIPQIILSRLVVTFYGDPALKDAEEQQQQQEKEILEKDGVEVPVPLQVPVVQVPFFTNPTACSNGTQVASLWIDAWQNPASFQPGSNGLIPGDLGEAAWAKAEASSPAVTGCNALQFTPELGVQPTTHEADKPSGLEFGLKLPQTENVSLAATPALKNIRVTFPEGMTVDPSSADGLGVCTDAQIGWFPPDAEHPNPLANFTEAKPECPESSKIGELELQTPLIPGVLHGEMFLAAQNANPFHSTFATYVVVNDPVTGVVLKIAGELKLNPTTGRITAVFDENPQLPFSNLQLHFFGGPRAELVTPDGCGTYTAHSEQEPWSFEAGDPLSTPFDSYVIDEDCPTGFAPGFTALSSNVQAGAYSSFEASFSRADDEPELGGLSVNLPPGLLANVASVPECGEVEIHQTETTGTERCPADTQVGTTEAGAGPGPNSLFVPGKVYFTGPYNGGPFGLLVVVPADPGPFDFGLVVVRQSLRIDPLTAAVTDVSDPFPTILDPVAPNGETNGIPIKLRRVDVDINRPGFVFNPTSCAKMTVGGTITSTHGAVSNLAVPFQAGGCQELKFAPKFSVSVTGKNTKEDGSSLTAKVTEPNVPQGADAGIHLVKVELPKQLPSRLTTLQKACTQKQFEDNPANCPKASKIGMAIVHTPILREPLIGPAIFVSHGGEAFPSLTLVLQGDGVTIDLVGTTFISKKSITSTTFKAVPDTPFSSFELTLPQSEFSALGTNVPERDHFSLCGQKLVMPNEFIGQNGAKLNEDTQIAITGCGKTLSRSALLSKALKACRKDRNKGKKAKCEATARKRYGSAKKTKQKGRK